MAGHLGDLLRCSDPGCGFEVLVVHDTSMPESAACPTCCCGRAMRIVVA